MAESLLAEPLIEVRDLHFRYVSGRSEALAGIDLTVKRGEFLGVTGPSGAGKSTLCLCIKGLVPAGTLIGTIRVAGNEVRANGPYQEGSALVFQDPETQIIGLTVAEDIAFGPENLERDPAQIRESIPDILRTVRLDGYAEAETFRLSGGQKQRLAIADALVLEPDLLILDEPTSELDPIGKDEVFEVVTRLREQRAVTVIMVEHAAEQLAEMADRIVVMDRGRIVAEGPPEELYRYEDFFHRSDGERAPQIAEILFELVRDGLIDPASFTAREEKGVEILTAALAARQQVQAHG
jgi:energy-coupling factor transporter ATP-binding protein EcfA2